MTERARMAFLALKREDVQTTIKAMVREDLVLKDRPAFDQVAREALEKFGYDLTGIKLSVRMEPGRFVMNGYELVQLPPTYVYVADAADEAVEAARIAAGVQSKGTAAQAPALN